MKRTKLWGGGLVWTGPELFFLEPYTLKSKCQLNICNREISNMDISVCVLIFGWCFLVPGLWRPWRLGGHAWDWRARREAPEQTHTADAVDSQVSVPLLSAALLQGHDTQSQPQAGSLAVLHVAGLEKAPSGWSGTIWVVWRHSHFRGATFWSGLLVWACNVLMRASVVIKMCSCGDSTLASQLAALWQLQSVVESKEWRMGPFHVANLLVGIGGPKW